MIILPAPFQMPEQPFYPFLQLQTWQPGPNYVIGFIIKLHISIDIHNTLVSLATLLYLTQHTRLLSHLPVDILHLQVIPNRFMENFGEKRVFHIKLKAPCGLAPYKTDNVPCS